MVMVRIPPMLRKYADGAARIDVEAATVAEAIEVACRHHPDLSPRLIGPHGLLLPHLLMFIGQNPVDRHDAAAVEAGPEDVVQILVAVVGGTDDVRMRGFSRRATVEEALNAALDGLVALPGESVPLADAAGRMLVETVVSPVDIPPFRRATMDGYAVVAEETFGAGPYSPIRLPVSGKSMPGTAEVPRLDPGHAIRIMTGAPVPDGADAVLQAEDASESGGMVEIRAPVPACRNVGRIGEDVEAGAEVLKPDHRLLPQDVGLLSAIGRRTVKVHRRPIVRVIVSGDELLPPGQAPQGTKIVDSNSPMLAALIERDGGVLEQIIRLPDGRDPMREALARPGADVIVTAGAASVGAEDHTPGLVGELGDLVVHGVAMRPSSPTGVGRIDDVPVLLLPGNPVSCLVAYDFFAGPAIRILGGGSPRWPYRTVRLPLVKRLVSQIGRTDYARVTVCGDTVTPLAIGGASVLSSLTRADGFVIIPAGSEGFAEGTVVDVGLFGGGV